MYDITNEYSFLEVNNWLAHIKIYGGQGARVILVANKTDLEEKRVIPEKRGADLAKALELPAFYEASAKEGKNVHQVYENMMDLLLDDQEGRRDSGLDEYDVDSIQLHANGRTEEMKKRMEGAQIKEVSGKEKCAC